MSKNELLIRKKELEEEMRKTPKRIARGEDDYENNDYYLDLKSELKEVEFKLKELGND